MLTAILNTFFFCSVTLISVYLVRHYIFTLTVLRKAKKPQHTENTLNSTYEPTVSILIPAHNEEKVIAALLQKLTETTYPKNKLEVLAIDDASSDTTGLIADEYSKKYTLIKVLHRDAKVGGKGKPAALNAALKQATGEIIVCFDADYTPHPDVVRKIVEKFSDPKVGAVQGRPVVLNEPQNMVTRLIALERIGGYRVDQQARDLLSLIPQFGGTVAGFRRSLFMDLGGFDESMLTEDTDLTFLIALEGYKIRYAGEAECYEEAVASWKTYWHQRQRWAKGHMQVCIKYAFKVVKSKHLTFKQKIDGLLLLNVYFMPLITMCSLLVGAYLVISGSIVATALWLVVPVSFYCFVGNYAPFFEVGIGAYLDERKEIQWLAPLLIFSFFFNMLICVKAFAGIILDKILGKTSTWAKTEHVGIGNCYIENQS
jgi:cellulose synthase/poly-beta-1,6-N-acetylglucosamine synthase-like glycosyltransferase